MKYRRTLNPYSYDQERVDGVTAARRREQEAMVRYAESDECRMQALGVLLDDPHARPCGICDNCTRESLPLDLDPSLKAAANEHLRSRPLEIEPRRQWPTRSPIPEELRVEPGRALCQWGDGGWGDVVRQGKQVDGRFPDELIEAWVELIRSWDPDVAWIAYITSHHHPGLVAQLAEGIGRALNLPVYDVVRKVRDTRHRRPCTTAPSSSTTSPGPSRSPPGSRRARSCWWTTSSTRDGRSPWSNRS